jgi:hypothetical protein
MKSPEKSRSTTPGGSRRKYATPVVSVYGAIRSITKNVANNTMNSDGAGPMAKTA